MTTVLIDREYADGTAIEVLDDDSDWVHLKVGLCTSYNGPSVVAYTTILLDDAVLDDVIWALTQARDLRERRRRVG